jgi:hypothetical protein
LRDYFLIAFILSRLHMDHTRLETRMRNPVSVIKVALTVSVGQAPAGGRTPQVIG